MTGKPITALRMGQCRFPVTSFDTDRHLFCAEPVEAPGGTYCAEHATRCYDRRPAEVRKAQAERAAAARVVKKPQEATAAKR